MDLITVLFGVLLIYITWKIIPVLKQYKYLCNITSKTNLSPRHVIWGHLNMFGDIEEYFHYVLPAVQKSRCKLYSIWLMFLNPVFTVVHPDTAKILLKSSEPKSKGISGVYRLLIPWLGDGLLISEGPKWERNRRLLTPAFHFDILKPYVTVYNQCADIFLDKLSKLSSKGSVEICGHVSQATLDTMLRCSLSYDAKVQQEGESHPYLSAVQQLTRLTLQRSMKPWYYADFIYFLSPDGRTYTKLCQYVHDFADTIISSRKEILAKDPDQLKKRRLDFLDILLTSKDESGVGLNDLEIRAEVDTFLFEGHDTTSSALNWAIYSLARYPEEQQKVYAEVQGVVNGKTYVEWEDLPQLRYLQLFIKEVLRYYSTVPLINRRLTKDTEIDGIVLPENSLVDIGIHVINHNPDVWPDHKIFKPERFLENITKEKDPYSYVPFSAGPRNCIGQNFAMNEIKVMISRLVMRFHIVLDETHDTVPVPEVVTRAKHGIKVYLRPR